MQHTLFSITMKKLLVTVIYIFAATVMLSAQTYDQLVEAYIRQYSGVAVEEMQRTGIPASITLAQGIIESNAGQSPLATQANNHFGIKCHVEWKGPSFTYDDDRKNECFRQYDSAIVSYRDHSDFLQSRPRYAVLFTYDVKDYKAWAKGLKACGYATNPQYANILIKCIDDYDLHQWDLTESERSKWFASLNKSAADPVIKADGNPAVVNAAPTIKNATERIYVFNDIDCVTLLEGESLNDLATTYEIGIKRLMRYNDITTAAQIATGDRVYLQPKRHNGAVATHTVLAGETMFSISRDHGIQLNKLYEKNLMAPGTQPAAGEVLFLQEVRKEMPALLAEKTNSASASAQVAVYEKPSGEKIHIVAKGDTLYSISKKYNVTVGELQAINHLQSTNLQVGEKLLVTK
ncbi:MAG: LysM peptidoglycan-binding domain-containing protein [Chitinophagales bacterium]|nr:LysM peptidoglycan-binding domain-containing protein [Chitinophagales bacterium]